MLKRRDTMVLSAGEDPTYRKLHLPTDALFGLQRTFNAVDVPRTPSPGEMSSASSALDEEEDYDPLVTLPRMAVSTDRQAYELWDPWPQGLCVLTGSLTLLDDELETRSGKQLKFSHFELEVKTHGRQGRFSRENIWSPQYVDYASTPIAHRPAQHLSRTRPKTFISFRPQPTSAWNGKTVTDFKVGLPQELFDVMWSRYFRITARAVFLMWTNGVVSSTEVLEADPITVSVSRLILGERTITG